MTTVLPPVRTNTAQATSVPITRQPDPASYCVVFSVPAANLQAGSVVFLESQVEVTNSCETSPFNHVVTIGRGLIRAQSATETTGTPVTEWVISDIAPTQWSEVFTLLAVDSGMAAGDYCYNVVFYAYSESPLAGSTLSIPQGYGDCSILIMNPSSGEV